MRGRFSGDDFIFEFDGSMVCLSNAPHNPGLFKANGFFIMKVDKDYNGDYRSDCRDFELKNGLKDFVGFMTATDIKNTLSSCKVGDVEVFVTTGLENKTVIGEGEFRFGTINLIVLIYEGVTIGCLVNAIMTAVEAKTYTLLKLVKATGTTSDGIGVFAYEGDLEWAGTSTELGISIGKAVISALKDSVERWFNLRTS